MRKISEKKKQAIQNKVAQVTDKHPSKTDPLGSYTGMPAIPGEMPQQDADDL